MVKKLANTSREKKTYPGLIPYTRINSRKSNDLNVNKNYRKHYK